MKKIVMFCLMIGLVQLLCTVDAKCNPFVHQVISRTCFGDIDPKTATHLLLVEIFSGRAQLHEVEREIQTCTSDILQGRSEYLSSRNGFQYRQSEQSTSSTSSGSPLMRSQDQTLLGYMATDSAPAGTPWLRPIFSGDELLGYQIQPPLPPTPPTTPVEAMWFVPTLFESGMLTSQVPFAFEWVGADHASFSLPQEQFRNLGSMFLIRFAARVITKSGALPDLWEPQDLIFSGVSSRRMDFGRASKFCTQLGGRLPSPEEYLALSRYLGAADPEGGDTSGYDRSLIPGTSDREFFTSRVDQLHGSGRQPVPVVWAFQEGTGRVIEDMSTKGKWVRCVFHVPRRR